MLHGIIVFILIKAVWYQSCTIGFKSKFVMFIAYNSLMRTTNPMGKYNLNQGHFKKWTGTVALLEREFNSRFFALCFAKYPSKIKVQYFSLPRAESKLKKTITRG